MTSADKSYIKELLLPLMTDVQRAICLALLKHHGVTSMVSKATGKPPSYISTQKKSAMVITFMKIMKMKETELGESNDTPTLEYLNSQWTTLYTRALEAGDDKLAGQILDKRMKYYEKFDELRKEDRINLSKLTIAELIEMENDRHNKVISMLEENKALNLKKTAVDKIKEFVDEEMVGHIQRKSASNSTENWDEPDTDDSEDDEL